MATGANANPWNISMDNEFNERFENYRQHFIKVNGALTKSEFARGIFEAWEKRYLELLTEIEENTLELESLIPKKPTKSSKTS